MSNTTEHDTQETFVSYDWSYYNIAFSLFVISPVVMSLSGCVHFPENTIHYFNPV